jgi:PAS domain-containing protein
MTVCEVEAVAQAFYDTLDGARGWEREPESLKEQLRMYARTAIAALDGHCRPIPASTIGPVVVNGSLEAARSFLMEAQDISVLPASSFRAVLRGPDHTFDVVNPAYYNLVGHRELLDSPVRSALPELEGQGYYDLLDQVYATRKPFVGRMVPVRLQAQSGGALEEHLIDFAYRPIENEAGHVLGLFVEGSDQTLHARA